MDNEAREKLHQRWIIFCRRLREAANQDIPEVFVNQWWELITQHYSEPHRAYHVLDHLNMCFKHFDQVAHLFLRPLAAEAAIWFHDYDYDTTGNSGHNEIHSASMAITFLSDCRIVDHDMSFCRTTKYMIQTTDHNLTRLETMTNDEQLICAIDLVILGQPWTRYYLYATKGIRQEYRAVPIDIYREKRAAILDGFIKRDRIYLPDYFHAKYEEQARANLKWEIKVLRSGEFPIG